MKIRTFLLAATILMIAILSSCSTDPVPIEYNLDQCVECKMMISDQRFGAEIVTKKGKVYKYDATECMVRYILSNREEQFAHLLVTDFLNPPSFINAHDAVFLISKERPSPMGANLSAYSSKESIETPLLNGNAKVLKWEELLNEFKS